MLKRHGLMAAIAALGALVFAGCAATTDPPSDVTASSAIFRAQGRTDSTPAHYYFQYSINPNALGTGFGQQTPTRGPIPAGVQTSGGGLVPFSEGVSGLKPATTYYYRVCGGDGQTSGDVCAQVRSFTTPDGVAFDRPGTYSWTVPAGVTRAQFDVDGGWGASGASGSAPGGRGAHVRAVLAVHAGDTLTIVVAGDGSGASGSGGAGGFGGGGAGGDGTFPGGGGGGGGGSDVRSGSDVSTRLLVAGGGGGAGPAGANHEPSVRGGNGGLVGEDGQDGTCQSNFGPCTPTHGGGGGTATGGGSSVGGQPGSLGVGGAGGSDTSADFTHPHVGEGGGGGGGGYYGGGGGESGVYDRNFSYVAAGGGGGSSFITPSALCSSPVERVANFAFAGAVTITYNPPPCP